MTDKRETLMSMLSKAYANPTIKADPALRALIETNAKKVDEGDDDKAYVTAVTQLSHDISKYYLIHHAVPEELVAVFNYIKKDVPAADIDAAHYRAQALAAGLVAIPIVWGH